MQYENWVTSRASLIHSCSSHCSILWACFEHLCHLFSATNIYFSCILNKNSLNFVFLYLQIGLTRIEEILYLFVINLKERNSDSEFDVVTRVKHKGKEVTCHPRNYTLLLVIFNYRWALHSKGLATGSLSIGKDGSIEALKHTLDDRFSDYIEDISLAILGSKDSIECKFMGVLLAFNL